MTRVRHIGPNNPELATRAGTILEEPIQTEGVVYVAWDGGPSGWIRSEEVENLDAALTV